jgi:hypothetical protein
MHQPGPRPHLFFSTPSTPPHVSHRPHASLRATHPGSVGYGFALLAAWRRPLAGGRTPTRSRTCAPTAEGPA